MRRSRRGRALVVGLLVAGCGPRGGTVPPGGTLLRAADPVPGRYIVVLRDGSAAKVTAKAAEAAQQHRGWVRHVYRAALNGYAAELSEREALAIAADPEVAFVEEDGRAEAVTSWPAASWGLDRIDQRALPLDGVHVLGASGAGVNAYVIDTGIRTTHVDFGGRAHDAFSAYGPPEDAEDCEGHGTHVAGTIGGWRYGVAPLVTLHAVRVLDCGGSGYWSDVIAGIDWVTENHVKPAVANMSLGGGGSVALDLAVARSVAAGVTYAVAAGNDRRDACQSSPAREPSAITVAASDEADAAAWFSNQGPCVDVFAPGVQIVSDYYLHDRSAGIGSGTSMASPHVAGAAALHLQLHPDATPAEVAEALLAEATPGIVTGRWDAGTADRLLYTGAMVAPPDPTPPTVSLTAPDDAITVVGTVELAAEAGDDRGVALVEFRVDGVLVRAVRAPPYRAALDTEGLANGSHVVEAIAWDDALNDARSTRTLTVANVGIAQYDPALGAPACAEVGPRCDSGVLLVGRDGAGEPNAPNTIFPACPDGWGPGTLHDVPSIDSVEVEAIGGGDLAVGRGARVTVRAFGLTGDQWVDVFAIADVEAPEFRIVASVPLLPGEQVVTAELTLADSPRQGVRVGYRVGGDPSACSSGERVDYDDLVFAAAPGTPDSTPPSVALAAPAIADVSPRTVHVRATASDDVLVNRVEFTVDGAPAGTDWTPPYDAVWTATAAGPHVVVARAIDGAGNAGEVAATVRAIDAEPPRVSVRVLSSGVAPPGTAVSRPHVEALVTCADNLAVAACELWADGALVASSVSPLLEAAWDAPAAGLHRLVARSRDASGNAGSAAVDVRVDGAPPALAVLAPAAGELLSGTAEVRVAVADDDAVAAVEVSLDGVPVGAATAPPFAVPVDTTAFPDGPRELAVTARDRAGNAAERRLGVELRNASSAARDPVLGVPACAAPAPACDSTRLVAGAGRDEAGAPNTLGGACTDPDTDALLRVERIRVSGAGAPLAPGAEVRVDVWVDPGPVAGARLELFHAPDARAAAPAWRFLSSHPVAGRQVVSTSLVLPAGTLQAIRAKLHEPVDVEPAGDPPACDPRTWYRRDDHDDLAFAVQDGAPPAVAIRSPVPGDAVGGTVLVAVDATDDGAVAGVELLVDEAPVAALAAPPWILAWDAAAAPNGAHVLVARAWDGAGRSARSAPVDVVTGGAAGPEARWDAALGVPRCAAPAAGACDSGTLLADGAWGREPGSPSTLAASCADGAATVPGVEEAVQRIRIVAADGSPLAAGRRVRVEATVRAYAVGDVVRLFSARDALAPAWVELAAVPLDAAGAQVVSASLDLPSGGLQAVRARIAWGGDPGACGGGPYDDHDDLAFEVQP